MAAHVLLDRSFFVVTASGITEAIGNFLSVCPAIPLGKRHSPSFGRAVGALLSRH